MTLHPWPILKRATAHALCAGLVLFAAPAGATAVDEKAQALVDEVILAHGGAPALARLGRASWRDQSTVYLNGEEIRTTITRIANLPDGQYLEECDPAYVVGYGNGKAWLHHIPSKNGVRKGEQILRADGSTDDLKAEYADEFLEQKLFLERVWRTLPLNDADLVVSTVPGESVNGRRTEGLRVRSTRGFREVTLYFDAQTHLLARASGKVIEFGIFGPKPVVRDTYFSDFQPAEGAMVARTFKIFYDGKPFSTDSISDVKVYDKIDKRIFAKPLPPTGRSALLRD